MNNSRLIELLQTELGKGKITNKGNIAFCCPFCSTTKKKLEIQSITSESGEKHRNGVKLAKLGGRNPNAKKCIWSARPLRSPATENDWQGVPPTRRSIGCSLNCWNWFS